MEDKEVGQQVLNMALDKGERLYPDTSTAGREKIRQQLRTAKDVWDSLQTDLVDLQRRTEVSATQWSAFTEGQGQLERWLLEVETWVNTDTDLKESLTEKRAQLQNNKVRN